MFKKDVRAGRLFSVLGLAVMLAWMLGQPTKAKADLIVGVSGPDDSGASITSGTAAAVGFHLDQPFQNVAVAADYVKFNVSGLVLLTNKIGPGTTLGNILADTTLDASTPISPTPIFSGLSLPADDYFLVFNQDASVVGQMFWNGSLSATATISTHPMASTGPFYFFAPSTEPLPAASDFSIVPGTALHFTVTGDLVSAVPEPSSLCLLLIGVAVTGGVPAVRRLRNSRQAA